MIQKTARDKQAEEMKNRILASALQLFDKYGMDNVSVADIAAAAKCSSGNIYHYFKSKAHIAAYLNQPRDDEYLQFQEMLNSSDEYVGLSSLEKLIEFFAFMCTAASKDTDNLCNLYAYALKCKDNSILALNDSRQLQKIFSELVDAIIADGFIVNDIDKNILIQDFIIICRGLLMEMQIGRSDFVMAERAREMIKIYMKGIMSKK
ncbi:MAG: TetR/AcrR family transcriptional regulator [Oscillospiraceae bacterium]|nr:TetR/AcrR family transcriptional regulator [Oscillospiraceae bacterium]